MSAMTTATTTALPANPTTPAYSNDVEWITAYLTIHMLSAPSRRYSYIFWIAVLFVFIIFGLLHWTGSTGGALGAYWYRWALRRRTIGKESIRKKGDTRLQPTTLPSNSQILCLSVIFIASMLFCFVGPDYIAPGLKVWQFYRREEAGTNILLDKRESFNTNLFTQWQPQYTINKAWWTSGGRTGLLAFTLFPLCVLFALKAPPFALFAISFMVQYYFDKLAWLHRWTGRLIWFITALHVALWSAQLARDQRTGSDTIAYDYAWMYQKFIFGWTAFGLMTLLILLSLAPIRRKYYEFFYAAHVILVPATLIMSALHHPPVWWWCWAALGLWIGERIWRATWWLSTNGFMGGKSNSTPAQLAAAANLGKVEHWEMKPLAAPAAALLESQAFPLPSYAGGSGVATTDSSPRDSVDSSPRHHYPSYNGPHHRPTLSHPSDHHFVNATSSYVPPPGYALAELVAGSTVRLRFITPGFLPWAPGQHFLITIPAVSRATSHPFTCASICDEQAPTDAGREMLMFVRAKQGWTKDLWDTVVKLLARGQTHAPSDRPPEGYPAPPKGVLMRIYVDGPFGSAARARWGEHSTVLIVVGGSGVSFGLAVLQYACMCLAGRDGRYLGGRPGGWGKKGFLMRRVRFVWIVRDFSHIQWCASILRRCIAMVPAPGLQIDIFVTNFKSLPVLPPRQPPSEQPRTVSTLSQTSTLVETPDGHLAPPVPQFARGRSADRGDGQSHSRSSSVDSTDSRVSATDHLVDLSYYTGEYREDDEADIAHRENLVDLTNWDGDDDSALPGEEDLSRTVRKVGKVRRANTRRAAKAERVKVELDAAVHGKDGGIGIGTLMTHLEEEEEEEEEDSHRHSGKKKSWAPYTQQTGPNSKRLSTQRLLSNAGEFASLDSSLHDRVLRAQSPPSTSASQGPWTTSRTSIEHDSGAPDSIRTQLFHSDAHHHAEHTLSPLNPHSDHTDAPYNRAPSPLRSPVSPWSDSHSTVYSPSNHAHTDGRSSVHLSIRELMPRSGKGKHGEEVTLEPDEQEMADIDVVSERTRPGKPLVDKILAEEVEKAKGSVVVACCGPTSLNQIVRKAICSQINPDRIRRGDMRGWIALVSEDFEY